MWLNLKRPIPLLRVPPGIDFFDELHNGHLVLPVQLDGNKLSYNEFIMVRSGVYELIEQDVKMKIGFKFEMIKWIVLKGLGLGCAKNSFKKQVGNAGEILETNPNLKSKFEVIFS